MGVYIQRPTNTECYKGSLPTETLCVGDTGDQVMLMQEFLVWYGYDIKIDGVFGPVTEAIVKNFQHTTGYQDSGVFDSLARYVAKYIQKEVGFGYATDKHPN